MLLSCQVKRGCIKAANIAKTINQTFKISRKRSTTIATSTSTHILHFIYANLRSQSSHPSSSSCCVIGNKALDLYLIFLHL